jgi:hypothetical protein
MNGRNMDGFALPAALMMAVGSAENATDIFLSHLLDLNIPVCFIR